MPGSPVAIGPFIGGLNLNEDPSIISDDQMMQCVNFDIGRAGELSVRPGLKQASTLGTSHYLLGTVRKLDGTYRTYARYSDATVTNGIMYSEDGGATWVASGIAAGAVGVSTAVIQYVDPVNTTVPYAFLIPKGTGSTTAGAGSRQNLNDNTVVNVTGMPNGTAAVIYRERLFIYGPTNEASKGSYRIWYSAAKNFTTFGVNNFIDVGPGDGEFVTHMAIQNDQMVIFKENSSWVLTFEDDPAFGILRKFNNEIGATSPNSVITFENQLYLIDQRSVFRLINLLFEEISGPIVIGRQRTATADPTLDSAVVLGRKLLFIISTAASTKRYFVYHTEVNAWSEYTFAEAPGRFISGGQTTSEFFLGSRAGSNNIYRFRPYSTATADWGDYPNDTTPANFSTKQYTFNSPHTFKRIHWWSMEIGGTQGSVEAGMVVDGVTEPSPVGSILVSAPRVFKLFVRNRFRRVHFTVSCSGNPRLTIFGVQAFVSNKAKVIAGATV